MEIHSNGVRQSVRNCKAKRPVLGFTGAIGQKIDADAIMGDGVPNVRTICLVATSHILIVLS